MYRVWVGSLAMGLLACGDDVNGEAVGDSATAGTDTQSTDSATVTATGTNTVTETVTETATVTEGTDSGTSNRSTSTPPGTSSATGTGAATEAATGSTGETQGTGATEGSTSMNTDGSTSMGTGSTGDAFSIEGVGTYAAVNAPNVFDGNVIVEVDPSDGAVLLELATLTGYTTVYGVAGWAGSIFAFNSGGEILRIDPDTGMYELINDTPYAWWGAGVRTILPQ